MEEIKNKVEALLFSSGRSMSVEEISNLVKVNSEEVRKILEELKKKISDNKATELIQEGDHWKLTVRDKYVALVTKVVTQTELSKSLMETLAVIAFKYPIKQSDLIKIRTNKAYDHLKTLEEQGYITRQRYGRTRLIKLAQKFFDYFDLPRDKLKEKFKDFGSLAKAIEEKEEIIEKMKKEKLEKEKERKEEKTEVIKEPEVDLVDEKGEKVKLEVVDEPEVYEQEEPEQKVEVFEDKQKLGDLEVVDEPEEKVSEEKEEEKEKIEKQIGEEVPEELKEEPDLMKELQEKKVKTEFEEEVDKRVDELLHPAKEEKEEEETEEEGEDLLEAEGEKDKENQE